MAFQILQSGIEFKQSSTHVFTFAVFEVSRSSFVLEILKFDFFVRYIKKFIENLKLAPVVSYT